MNDLARMLLVDDRAQQKVAARNFSVDALGGIGTGMRAFSNNPIAATSALGGLTGAAYGAATADTQMGESRLKRALTRGAAGAAGGLGAGALAPGAMKTLGRYGESLSQSAKTMRAGGADAPDGAIRKMLEEASGAAEAPLLSARANVRTARDAYKPNAEAAAEKKILEAVRKGDSAAEAAARAELAALNVPGAKDRYTDAVKALRDAAGGRGGMLEPSLAAGLVAGSGVAGAVGLDQYEKRASARLAHILKTANFGALAAQAVGKAAQGVGTAISAGAANPALAGAAIGATTGAITAGEGNRISGALAGGALGAGAGAGLAKLAPQATENLAQFGKVMRNAGKMTASHAKGVNATFSSATRPLGKLNTEMANFAKANRGLQGPATQAGATAATTAGMSGSQAALMGTGLVGGAGILGGAAASGGNTPQNQANAAAIRQRFSNVAMT